MDLTSIWTTFISKLNQDDHIHSFHTKNYGGLPFGYIKVIKPMSQPQLENLVIQYAREAMKGKRLTFDMIYVRHHSNAFVYRMRFKVPQEKLFCCGNGCSNCVRLKQ
ncbi:hypothetical protein N0O92_02805 [Alkalihalobacillus sp. MEB130]|uniref:hypothetical protein n=1 Tax=Alkalihalobacillus sp. MEB130 TaxID=2976704 RepID=UPI0028DF5CB0|nr:hypothetical protein [Alkalihalobacillus sp. MEB130]MDT8859147.1 hypothetical protein [Alkalihalobacillus sp. MEB130]